MDLMLLVEYRGVPAMGGAQVYKNARNNTCKNY